MVLTELGGASAKNKNKVKDNIIVITLSKKKRKYASVVAADLRLQFHEIGFLCLAADPIWAKYDDTEQSQDYTSKIYGTEYDFQAEFTDGGAKFFGQNLQDHDAPECYPNWTKEYAGNIVSGAPNQISPTNYICLDQNAETERGDARDDNGKVLYL
ncbi:hypothetical protein MAR_037648, partial [Mya arenaria]